MSDIFNGGSYVGVVNAPDLGVLKSHPQLLPFVTLAERIGSMQAQLLGNNKIGSISINLRGLEVSDSRFVDVLKAAVLKGALSELQDRSSISLVNASAIAENMGLVVNVNTSTDPSGASGFLNDISVDLEMEGFLNMSRTVRGTVFGSEDVRITEIDGYSVDLPSGDHVLLFNNQDRPGVLRKIAEKLFKHNINIAHFSLGRKGLAGSKAMGAVTIDSPAPAEIIRELNKSHDVSNMVQLDLTSASETAFRIRSAGDVNGLKKPAKKPKNPEFSSGPCKKRPGYSIAKLRVDVLGRSHRSKLGKARLKRAIEDTKRILGVPDDYLCGIVPASDTGAFEMAMWSMLGPRPVDACHWESFGKGWKEDAVKHLKLKDLREFKADYGKLPDLTQTNPDHDILFTFNGTTSGVRVPDLNWISDDRKGLTFNDATSAAFAMQIDWKKVDVTTFSWQKVLGGEGAHGVLILSPRAVERLESFVPDRPLPKIFRMTKKDKDGKVKLEKGIFNGDTINTPSMICVEDYIDALEWADSIGGLDGLIQRSKNNIAVLERFVSQHNWIHFLAQDPSVRSNTSVCLTLDLTSAQVKKFVELLDKEGVAYDVGSYRDAPDGLRIWCGATVETEDLEALMPWLEVSYFVSGLCV
jgi:phosphoserine aminotransferase